MKLLEMKLFESESKKVTPFRTSASSMKEEIVPDLENGTQKLSRVQCRHDYCNMIIKRLNLENMSPERPRPQEAKVSCSFVSVVNAVPIPLSFPS
jgi:hypothetical protein